MRRKLSFAMLGLALTTAALVSGARPAQANAPKCTTTYCQDGSPFQTCCLINGQLVCNNFSAC
ncbi:MAG TPA: hypothetical protein VIE43_27445 [Thermoanaerobaculia bacterium]|jgi:hypothetical protein|nr:hypothetical protein [Thermoanaerobaculia bacterium]